MVKRILKFGSLIALVWLLMVVATLPAAQVIPRIQLDPRQAAFYQVSGSAYKGSAEAAIFSGMRFAPFNWDLQLSSLFSADVSADISGDTANGNAELNFTSAISELTAGNPNGPANFSISDLKANLPLQDLPLPPIAKAFPLEASLLANINQLQVENRFPVAIDGNLALANLRYKLGEQWLDFGTVIVTPRIENGALIADLSSDSELATISGFAKLDATGQYSVDAFLAPTEKMPKNITGMLGMAGKKQPDGSFLIKRNGRINLPK